MKQYLFILIAAMLFANVLVGQNEPIKVEEAPTSLPQILDGWKTAAEDVINNISFESFVQDPNYLTSAYADDFGKYKDGVVNLLNNKALLKTFCDWISPTIKTKWASLDYMTKAKSVIALQHCKKYLTNFSMATEDAYLEECTKAKGGVVYGDDHVQFHRGLPGDSYFAKWDRKKDFFDNDLTKPFPEFVVSPYRRLETFFYRRAKDGITTENMLFIIDQILSMLTLPQNGTYETKDSTGNLLERVSFKNGQLEGSCTTYKYNKITSSGKYSQNSRTGKWIENFYSYDNKHELEDQSTMQYEKGRIVSRTWKSFWATKLNYSIWFDVKKKKYKFINVDTETGAQKTEFEGDFFGSNK